MRASLVVLMCIGFGCSKFHIIGLARLILGNLLGGGGGGRVNLKVSAYSEPLVVQSAYHNSMLALDANIVTSRYNARMTRGNTFAGAHAQKHAYTHVTRT